MIRGNESRPGRTGRPWLGAILGTVLLAGTPAFAAALTTEFTGPATFTPGTSEIFVITVTNPEGETSPEFDIATVFPEGARVEGVLCSAQGTGSVCNDRVAEGELASSGNTVAATNGSITLELNVRIDSGVLGSLEAESVFSGAAFVTPVTETVQAAPDPEVELMVAKSSPATAYTPGTTGAFSLEVANEGPSDAAGITLLDPAPEGMVITAWTCAQTIAAGEPADCPVASGQGDLDQLIYVPADAVLTFSLDVEFAASAVADPLVNAAGLVVPQALRESDPGCVVENPDDPNDPPQLICENHSDEASLTRVAVADLGVAIDRQALPATYVPGTDGRPVSIELSNTGPSDAFGARFSLVWPDQVAGVSWACQPEAACTPTGGAGDAVFEADVPADGSVTLNATLAFDSGARADLVLEPSIEPAAGETDDDADNPAANSDSVTLAAERRADISVIKSASIAEASPGASFTYTVEIENLGPSDLGPDPDDPGTVEEIGLLLNDVFPTQLLGDLGECGDPGQPCWRVCANDNGITGNYGPRETDGNGLNACPTAVIEGSGDIVEESIALAAGSTTTLRAFVRVADSELGTMQNTAEVRLNDGPQAQVREATSGGGSDSSTVETPIELATDIRVEKTDGTQRAIAGEPHTYTIDVVNPGFVTANNVSVLDELPLFDPARPGVAGFVPGTISWQCRAFGGACCNSNSSACGTDEPTQSVTADILANAVDLPGQSQVRFTVTGTLDPRAGDLLSNTASAELPESVGDTNGANNTDTDGDTSVEAQADLQLDKSVAPPVSVGGNDFPPFELEYRIEISNPGPSFVAGAEVIDLLSADVFETTRDAAVWTCEVVDNPGQTACENATGNGPLNGANNGALIDIDPGGRVAFTLTVRTGDTAAGTVDNVARVTSAAGRASDSASTSLRGTTRLAITTTDNRSEIAPGDSVEYTVRVENEGPDDAFGARVTDIFPPVVDSVAWSCSATTPIPGDLGEFDVAGAVDTAADALVTSPDGRHVYAIGTETDSLFVFARNSVPGANFGNVAGLETEINGVDDSGDAGGAVTGMGRPLDVAISPDGLNVYALAKPEPTPVAGFSGQYDPRRWDAFTQDFGCGSSGVLPGPDEVVLETADGCAAIFAAYTHDGVDEAGTVTFDWEVTESQSHTYAASAGRNGEDLTTLTSSTPGSGTMSIAVAAGDQVRFNVSKSSGFGVTTLRITNFRFTAAEAARPSLVAFSRSSIREAGDFGELSFLGSVSDGLPTDPVGLAMTNDNIYVYGSGDPEGAPGNENELIAILDRSGVSGVPAAEAVHTEGVPAAGNTLVADASGNYLFAGGATLSMFSIDPASGQVPAGRLTFLEGLTIGDRIETLTLVDTAPQLYGRAAAGGQGQLFSLFYLDADGNPAVDFDPLASLTVADMTLPAGVGDPLTGRGRIDVAPDGEHLAGVSAENGLLYQFRRDPVSGALEFQEAFASDVPEAGDNRGLQGAADVAYSADGRHLLIAASANATETNPPLAVYTRRAPDPLFAFLEQDVDGDPGLPPMRAPNDVAISPDGTHVYTVSFADDSLLRFDRFPRLGLDDESAGQHLQFAEVWFDGLDGVSGLNQPRRILMSPDGESVFVTSDDNNSIAVFQRNADPESTGFGTLTFLQRLTDGGDVAGIAGAQGMAMDPESRHLYVAGSFSDAIARFERQTDGTLIFADRVLAGEDGVVDLDLVRDLVVSPDGGQLLAVSAQSNALVVFDRDNDRGSDTFGQLSFVQSQRASIGVRPISLDVSPDGAHVYVTGQNSNSLAVLRRVTDPSSSAFGQVQPLAVLSSGSGGLEFMEGPRDVTVSPDGKRIYVAAEFSGAVVVFDRDLNAGGSRFGIPSPVEVRRNNVLGVAGLRQARAVAVSVDSRNVYSAGFGDGALASFRLGVGSVCTAGGSGNIDDVVDIGVNGTIVYRASGVIRPDATGTLVNRAEVCLPSSFVGIDPQLECAPEAEGGAPADGYADEDITTLVPQGDVSVRKENDVVSVTAGETARYTVTIDNTGPSSLVHEAGAPLTVSDPLDPWPDDPDRSSPFVIDSAAWSCRATGSGSLEFDRAWRNLDPEDNTSGPFGALAGITGLTLVPTGDGAWLAGASVIDDSVSLFSRDAASGALVEQVVVASGDMLDGQPVSALDGAQSLVSSADGRYLYVASRVSDSVTVFAVGADAEGRPTLAPVQTVTGLVGLNQAVHLALSPDGTSLYVAGANDDAVAAFARDPDAGTLTWIDSVQQGIDGVSGLTDVSHVRVSPDGEQLYALSPTSDSVAVFDRGAGGGLTWRRSYDGLDFSVGLDGAASAVFDDAGRYLYVAARRANRIVVLERDTSATDTRGELALSSHIDQDQAGVNGLFGVGRLALSGDGVHVYATSPQTDTVAWFIRDDETGALRFGGLRSNQGDVVRGLGGVTGVVVDDVLNQVWIAGTDDAAIGVFQRQADSFCPASGTGPLVDVPFNIGAGGRVVFTIDVEIAGDATGVVENTVFLDAARDTDDSNNDATESNVVSAEADLAITKSDGLSEIDGLAGARAAVATARNLYVAGPDDNALGVLARIDDPGTPRHGNISFVQAVRAGADDGTDGINGVVDAVLTGDGAHLYSASPVDNAVAGFERDPISGTLAFLDIEQNGVLEVNGIAGARDLALSPDDRHLYAAGSFSNAVAIFEREVDPGAAAFGELSFAGFVQNGVDEVGGLGQPVALAASADGLNVYAIGGEQDTLAVFRRNRNEVSASFGQLEYRTHFTNNLDDVAGLAGARDLVVSRNGEWVFVLGEESGTIAIFDRNVETGELAFDSFIQDGTGGTSGLTGASALLLDDATGTLYVAGSASASIARYQVDLAVGEFTFLDEIANGDASALTGGEVFGLEEVAALALSPDGDHVYAASSGRDAALTFQRPVDGTALEFKQILIDGQGGIAPGSVVEYVIEVENLGPSDVGDARIVDQFPEAFEAVQWVCSAQQGSGAACLAGGDGDVDTIASLPAGGRITIRASGTVSANATGRLINTATVSAADVTDPVQANNSATDSDTVLSPSADLIVEVDNGLDRVTPGEEVTWDVVVSNNGPSSVRGVFVEDQVPASLFDVAASCTAEPSAGVLNGPGLVDARGTPSRLALSAEGRWAYAAGGDQLEVFRRDPLTGTLASNQLLEQGVDGVTGIRAASDVAVSSDGRFIYVAGARSDSIALFGPSDDGEDLRFIAAVRDGRDGVEGIGGVTRLLLSPDGSQLYAAGSEDQALAVFSIDAASGLLTPAQVVLQGAEGVDGLAGLADLAWAEDGEVLLAVAADNQSLAAFERNPVSGELTFADVLLNDDLLGTAAAGALLQPAAVIEAGDELLVAAAGDDRIGRFVLEPADPQAPEARVALAPVGSIDGETLGMAVTAPLDLEFVADQRRLYVATADGLMLVNLLAELPEVIELYPAESFATLTGLQSIALGPNLRQVYTVGALEGAEIAVWSRERGSRCPLTSAGGLGRQRVDIVAGGRLVYQVTGRVQPNATGEISYTVEVDNPVDGQELNPADNRDTDTDPLVPAPDLEVVKQLAGDPPVVAGLPVEWRADMANLGLSDAARAALLDPLPVFPADPGGVVADSGAWRCEANLPLTPLDSASAPAAANAIAIGPRGRYVYASAGDADALLVFALAADGALGEPVVISDGDALPGGTVEGLAGASSVAVSDDGLQVYVTAAAGNSLLVFTRETLDAPLDFAQRFTTVLRDGSSTPGLRGARDVALSIDQRRVFVAGEVSDAIAIFDRDERTGLLEFNNRVSDGIGTIVPEFNVIQGVSALHVAGDAGDLYAIAGASEAITRFSINPESGVATFENVWRAGDAGLPELGGIRAISAAPGDTHMYVLTDAGVIVLRRESDGALVFDGLFDAVDDVSAVTALQIDAAGSRAYLLAASAEGAVIHVLRRDWNDGSLEFWFSQAVSDGAGLALVQSPDEDRLYASVTPDALTRFDEQALSRCLAAEATTDTLAAEIDLGAGGWSVFDISAVVHPSARGDLVNTAEAVPSSGEDPDPVNNVSTVSLPIEVVSDIAITKTGPAEAVAGTAIEYALTVTNAGPSDALGIRVRDPALDMLSELQWTCTASQGSSCPAEGTGAPDFAADVLVDGQLDIRLQAFIDPAFIGQMINVAVLEPEPDATDPTPDDRRAEAITEVVAVADVAVTKTTLTQPVIAGQPVEYRLEAVNNGPSDAAGVHLTDVFPAPIDGAAWTCSATAGATCPAAGDGAIDTTLPMPVGSSIEFIVTGDLGPEEVGELTNRLEATVDAPATDPDPGNNAARVDDPIEVWADVGIELRAPINPFDPGGVNDLPLELFINSAGPSNARNIDVTLDFSAPVLLTSQGCTQPRADRVRCLVSQLDPGGSRVLDVALAEVPVPPGSLQIDGLVTSSADNDPRLADNADALTIDLRSGIDLNVSVDNGRDQVAPDESLQYTIVVDNYGSVAAVDAGVEVDLPPELLDAEWTCEASGGANCAAFGLGAIADSVSVPSGGRLVYTLDGLVDPALDPEGPGSVTVTAAAEADPPEDDFNRLNNQAVDQDGIGSLIFEDSFESVAAGARTVARQVDSACLSVALTPDAAGLDGAASLEALGPAGRRLLWIDTTRARGSRWVQLSTLESGGAAVSGWWPVPSAQAAVELHVEAGIPALRIDGATVWQAPEVLPAAFSMIQASAGSTSSACVSSGQPETLESSQ